MGTTGKVMPLVFVSHLLVAMVTGRGGGLWVKVSLRCMGTTGKVMCLSLSPTGP